MKKIFNLMLSFLLFSCFVHFCSFAQETAQENKTTGTGQQVSIQEESISNRVTATATLSSAENVTLDFKDADIQNVLKILSYKSGMNIVSTPDVIGNVTIRLVDVPWDRALDIILKTYGYGYQKQGNVILVTKMDNISKIQSEEPLQTEVFILKFLDAQDAMKILIPLLSPRGKISILYTRGQKGWQFGTFKIGKESVSGQQLTREKEESAKSETIYVESSPSGDILSRKAEFQYSVKSKILLITDTLSSLDRIRNIILPQIDRKPKQVLIEARLLEVSRDKLKDLGVDFGTGVTGAESSTPGQVDLSKTFTGGGGSLSSLFTPSVFSPLEGTSLFPGYYPYKAGAQFILKKITGTQFEAILHALEEDVHTNTLSAPRILTLDNQEAAILVGYHTPIIAATVSAGSSTQDTTVSQTLDYYQEIGIRLNVVPQVNDEGYINMIIHPSVTSSNSSVTATSVAGGTTVTTTYPVIDVREAQTQVLIKDGETIVIGGLLKDVKSKQSVGVPFLSKIPILGNFFKRETNDIQKVDLLIFITARIVNEGEFSEEEAAKLEKGIDPYHVYPTIKKKNLPNLDKQKVKK
ncbi:MAG: secretin and TonB N-terminal domain-containing protein [Candidatus Omnitrophica bacterium]|nr:secretin and TonB N-terminal domain-containing protein [Candidatus Omnitrophota bacterium]